MPIENNIFFDETNMKMKTVWRDNDVVALLLVIYIYCSNVQLSVT